MKKKSSKTVSKKLLIKGEVFAVEDCTAFLILPTQCNSSQPTPWVFYAPTLPGGPEEKWMGGPGNEEKWMFEKFLAEGIAIAGVDVGESYGSPKGRAIYTALHKELVEQRGLSQRACLLARSRGGLMLYNWAVEHPSSVACIAGIYPACNLSTYPGLGVACKAYEMTETQLAAKLFEHNPIDRIAPLAKAGIPIFHIHGDEDTAVPFESNAAELARRYEQLGGKMTLSVIKGRGHDMWPGWFQCQPLVDFVIAHAREKNDPNTGKVFAQETPEEIFEKLIPAEKNLDPAWVKSLFERGERETYKKYYPTVGMPVGGLCAGTVYLSGDGRLWFWDVFNRYIQLCDEAYRNPMKPTSPMAQGFAISIKSGDETQVRTLDANGFENITFTGEYPIGFVEYSDSSSPVSVSLEAFSPFIPLNSEESEFPATVMHYTLSNISDDTVEVELNGWLENAVLIDNKGSLRGNRHNKIINSENGTILLCTASETQPENPRSDIIFEDFEGQTWEKWQAEGEAFGTGPRKEKAPKYVIGKGYGGSGLGWQLELKGKLISNKFKINRKFINFLIASSFDPPPCNISLVVDGQVVRNQGEAYEQAHFKWRGWDVEEFEGKMAHIEIADSSANSLIHIDQITFSDDPYFLADGFVKIDDYGSMAMMLLGKQTNDKAAPDVKGDEMSQTVFTNDTTAGKISATTDLQGKLIGKVGRTLKLKPGQSEKVTFVMSWYFPNLGFPYWSDEYLGRNYSRVFDDAADVAEKLAIKFDRLYATTTQWHDTWYDSTLPYWFLNRTMINTSSLATQIAIKFANGRFYGYEGYNIAGGTFTPQWVYIQAIGRLFPSTARNARNVNFSMGMTDEGYLIDRTLKANTNRKPVKVMIKLDSNDQVIIAPPLDPKIEPCLDGHCGTIINVYREHLMTPDNKFLKKHWANIKDAMNFVIRMDGDGDGLIHRPHQVAYDGKFFGANSMVGSMYVGALLCAEQMAIEMGEPEYARCLRVIADRGSKNISEKLWNGEYFNHVPEKPTHNYTVIVDNGCMADQMLGQSLAFQAGLEETFLPKEKIMTALKSIWKYNYTKDAGPYVNAFKQAPWNAHMRRWIIEKEPCLLACTFPHGGRPENPPYGNSYFNSPWNGAEYQVAAHMIWQGMTKEGLAIIRSIHDRNLPTVRNPWNEMQTGYHYCASMASYGLFPAICGFLYNGPKGILEFDPKITPDDFEAAFVTSEGWGTFSQNRDGNNQINTLDLKYGKLRLKTIKFKLQGSKKPKSVKVEIDKKSHRVYYKMNNDQLTITFDSDIEIKAGQKLSVQIK